MTLNRDLLSTAVGKPIASGTAHPPRVPPQPGRLCPDRGRLGWIGGFGRRVLRDSGRARPSLIASAVSARGPPLDILRQRPWRERAACHRCSGLSPDRARAARRLRGSARPVADTGGRWPVIHAGCVPPAELSSRRRTRLHFISPISFEGRSPRPRGEAWTARGTVVHPPMAAMSGRLNFGAAIGG